MIANTWIDLKALIAEESEKIDKLVLREKEIILFGAGFYGSMIVDYFNNRGYKVRYFCDNDVKKQGKDINGIYCLAPEELQNHRDAIVFISARHKVQVVLSQLEKLGIESIVFDKYLVRVEIDNIDKIYNNYLEDQESKMVYFELIKAMYYGEKASIAKIFTENQYFCLPEFIKNNTEEIFLDCGAYVGNTTERFIWSRGDGLFRKIYAFEPGEKQFLALKQRSERLKKEWALNEQQIECVNAAVGVKSARESYLLYDTQLSATRIIEKDDQENSKLVEICSIDDFFSKDGGYEDVSFIKMDVEGSELDVIEGGKNLIEIKKPKLAVCVYHRPTDIIDIPIYIKKLVPQYKIALRHHSHILSETVLYCWI